MCNQGYCHSSIETLNNVHEYPVARIQGRPASSKISVCGFLYEVRATKGAARTLFVTHITNEITHARMLFRQKLLRHFQLFQFITGEIMMRLVLCLYNKIPMDFLAKEPVPPVTRIFLSVNKVFGVGVRVLMGVRLPSSNSPD